jgi:selenocysteine lyase/cysteine desulfurase
MTNGRNNPAISLLHSLRGEEIISARMLAAVEEMFGDSLDELDDAELPARLRPMFAFHEDPRRWGVPMNVAIEGPSFAGVTRWTNDYRMALDLEHAQHRRARARAETISAARRSIAELCLGADEADVALVRDAIEGNATVVKGLRLDARDAVVLWDENTPSNGLAWRYETEHVELVNLCGAGSEAEIVARFAEACDAIEDRGLRVRVLSFSELSASSGLRLPTAALCQLGRRHGAHVHVDASQSWGATCIRVPRDVNARPHSMTASAHKWLCGPREAGFLYMDADVARTLRPRMIARDCGGHAPPVPAQLHGDARRFEVLGPRDDPKLMAMQLSCNLIHDQIGVARGARCIAARASELVAGLAKLGLELVTPTNPQLRHGIVVFEHADSEGLRRALEQHPRHKTLASAFRHGADARPVVRLCPHVYNTQEDIDGVVSVVAAHLRAR